MKLDALLLDIARPLLPALPHLTPRDLESVERDLSASLAEQIGAMPLYLAAPFRIGLVAFELLPLLRFGKTYRALPADRQQRVVYAWANTRIGAFRNFVKLVRSCALYAYLDHPLVTAQLERESAEPAAPSREVASSHAG